MMQKLDWLPQDLHNTQAINPLAGCAAPLLTIAYQLTEQTEPLDDTESLITTLLEECKHFYQKANKMGYHVQQILAAQYWLCATLDELITDLPNPNKQQYPSLLKQLNHPSESLFFAILDEQEQASKPSGDTLEIAYLCLCLGYRNNHPTLILEKRQAKLLSQTQNIRQKPNNSKEKSRKKITHLIITPIILITTVSLITIYTNFQHTLEPLNHALSEINQHNISTKP